MTSQWYTQDKILNKQSKAHVGNFIDRHHDRVGGISYWRKLGRPALHTEEPPVQLIKGKKKPNKSPDINMQLLYGKIQLLQGLPSVKVPHCAAESLQDELRQPLRRRHVGSSFQLILGFFPKTSPERIINANYKVWGFF